MTGTVYQPTSTAALAASPNSGESIATAEEIAATTFDAQRKIAALGRARFPDARSWTAERAHDFSLITIALWVLDLNADEVAAFVEQEPIAFVELVECLEDRREFFEGMAALCGGAHARVLVGLARFEVAHSTAAKKRRRRRRAAKGG